jgi:Holliday junction resolvase
VTEKLSKMATDSRTESEASKDLIQTSQTEESLINRFLNKHLDIEGFEAVHLGGSSVNPVGNVDVRPDFKVVNCFEVKHSSPLYKGMIHIKKENLKACKYHKARILFVNGLKTENPEYTIMRPETFLKEGEDGVYHSTPSKKLPYSRFNWEAF